MNKKIEVNESDLVKIKSVALSNYKQKSVRGLRAEAFWSRCAIDAINSVLKLELDVKYPDKYKEKG